MPPGAQPSSIAGLANSGWGVRILAGAAGAANLFGVVRVIRCLPQPTSTNRCCSSTNPNSLFRFKFKFPSNPSSLPTAQFGGKPFKSLSPSLTAKALPDGNQDSTSYGRRALFFMVSLLPTLQNSRKGFDVNAADDLFLIQGEIRKVLSKAKAAGVLRLVFHDAGTYEMDDNSGGMNGSITYELDRPENGGLKKPVKVLEKAKTAVNMLQSEVSWADIIAVAGAEAVSLCGGPSIPVQLGRLDSEGPDPEGRLPEETLDAFGLKQCFHRKGLSTQELVVLAGAHTLGSKGFGNPTIFDNSYFKILLEKPWSSSGSMTSMIGLPSDRALVEDDECLRWISKYAEDENLFFEDFKNAYIKLVNSGAMWKTKSV